MSKQPATRKKSLFTPVNMALIGVMTALSTVIYYFLPEIPIIPGVEHLKFDFADIPAILLGITVNPIAGALVEVFKNLVHLPKSTTMGIGELMNIGVGLTIILTMHGMLTVFSKVFHRKRLHALPYFFSAAVAILATILAGWLLNWVLTPVFYHIMGFPLTDELLFAGVFGSTALNALKAAINLLPFYPVIYAVDRALSRQSIKG